MGRSVRKRIRFKQAENRLIVRKQLREEVDEPWMAMIRAHRSKPHEPIKAEMIWRDLRRQTRRISWFPFELVFAPLGRTSDHSLVSTLDHDLVTLACDTTERSIGSNKMKTVIDRIHDLSSRKQVAHRFHAKHDHQYEDSARQQPKYNVRSVSNGSVYRGKRSKRAIVETAKRKA